VGCDVLEEVVVCFVVEWRVENVCDCYCYFGKFGMISPMNDVNFN
jgi:hypothetical protein